MANWQKLNEELDRILREMTPESWAKWQLERQGKRDARRLLYEKATEIQQKNRN